MAILSWPVLSLSGTAAYLFVQLQDQAGLTSNTQKN